MRELENLTSTSELPSWIRFATKMHNHNKMQSRQITNLNMIHTHTHPFIGPLSGTTQVSRYQKCKINLDFTGAASYRPISLLSICYKLLECIILQRISTTVENLLSVDQAGFCRGRSTCDQVTALTMFIENVKAHAMLTYTNGVSPNHLHDCGQRQTTNHIVDTCPLTKSEGGLNVLHTEDDDAVI